MSDSKACVICGKVLPQTSQFFHKSSKGAFHPRCRHCRSEKEKASRKKKGDERLNEIEKGAVDLFIASARIGGANIPHTSELVEVLMEYCGGVRGFCNLFMKQFYDAPAGGAFRTKQLDTVMRLVVNNTVVGGAKKPLTLWSEEELDDELKARLLETAIILNALPAPNEKTPAPNSDSQDP